MIIKKSEENIKLEQNSSKPVKTKKSFGKRLRGMLFKLVIFALGLFLLVSFLIRLPSVQNYLVNTTTTWLSNQLGVQVKIDEVALDFFDEFVLNGVFIQDQAQDTLLYAESLSADIIAFSLLKSELLVEALTLENAQVNLKRSEEEGTFNFQFIVDYFAPKTDEQAPEKTSRHWLLGVELLSINDVRFILDDEIKGEKFNFFLGDGKIGLNEIAQDSVLIDAKYAAFDQFDFRYIKRRDAKLISTTEESPTVKKPKVDSLKKGFTLAIHSVKLKNGYFAFDDFRKVASELDGIDFPHVKVRDIAFDIDDFLMKDGDFSGDVKSLTAKEKSGFLLDKMKGKTFVNSKMVRIHDIDLRTEHSHIGDTLILKYREYADFLEFVDKVKLDARFNETQVALKDILYFAPKLKKSAFVRQRIDDVVELDGMFKGQINKLKGKGITIAIHNRATVLRGDFRTRDLTDPALTFLDVKIEQLNTSISEIERLVPNAKTPPNFSKLGKLKFNGTFTGFYKDFVAEGALITDLGKVESDLQIQLKEGLEKAVYSGNLAVKDFDAGTWSGSPLLGIANFKAKLNGKGVTANTVAVNIDGEILSFGFKDYVHENIIIDGEFEQKKFAGKLAIDEENLRLTFDGKVDFNDSLPVFDLEASIKELNLLPLNLSKQNLSFSGDASLNFTGNNLDNFAGMASAYGLSIQKDSIRYQVDSLSLRSSLLDFPRKRLELQSEILTASIEGEFDLLQLPNSIARFVEVNYPNWATKAQIQSFMFVNDTIWTGATYVVNKKPITPKNQEFTFDIDVRKTKNLTELFVKNLQEIQDAKIYGNFSSSKNTLILNGNVPKLVVQNTEFGDINLITSNKNSRGDIILTVDHIHITDSLKLPPIKLEGNLANDTLGFELDVAQITKEVKNVNINGILFPTKDYFQLSLLPSDLQIFENTWDISGDNYVRFAKNLVQTKNVVLNHKNERISLNSVGEKGLLLSLDNIDLGLINDLVYIRDLIIEGRAFAALEVGDIYGMKDIQLKARIAPFLLNGDEWGVVTVKAESPQLKEPVEAVVKLIDGKRTIEATGQFIPPYATTDPQKVNYFDFNIVATKYSVAFAEYFLSREISDPIGKFDADIRLFGTPKDPNIEGEIHMYETSVTVDYLQTRYFLDDVTSKVSNYGFDLSGNTARDDFGNIATIKGAIVHQKFRNFGLDVRLESDQFLLLNTEKKDNPDYYGQAFGAAKAHFNGPFTQINIKLEATSSENTELTIPLSTSSQSATEVSFIEFRKRDTTKVIKVANKTDIRGVNVDMNLNITPQAKINLIFDEQAGDIVQGNGTGNIQINVTRTGGFTINGDYEIEAGEYLFTYQNFINKPFEVKPGGTIKWSGDPYNAQIDFDAFYSGLRVPPYNFILEYLTGENVDSEVYTKSRNTTEVTLTMNLQGELLKPAINFDIEFPSVDTELKSYINSKLNSIKGNNNELNRQVFALIVLGNFLPPTEINTTPTAGTLFGINTLSELITNQLSLYVNSLLSDVVGEGKVISSIDFDIGYRISQLGEASDLENQYETSNQVQLGLKNRFLNDRLTVGIGGNFDITSSNSSTNPESGAYFAGDFAIEYLLTADGRYKVRAYNRSQFGESYNNIRTGIGMAYRRQFDTFSEFLESLRKKATDRKRNRKTKKQELPKQDSTILEFAPKSRN